MLEKIAEIKKINFAFQMDEFYSDNFFDGNAPIGWSERDWFDYLKKSEREISKFASGLLRKQAARQESRRNRDNRRLADSEGRRRIFRGIRRRVLRRAVDAPQPPRLHNNPRAYALPARTPRRVIAETANLAGPRLGHLKDHRGNVVFHGARRKFHRFERRPGSRGATTKWRP